MATLLCGGGGGGGVGVGAHQMPEVWCDTFKCAIGAGSASGAGRLGHQSILIVRFVAVKKRGFYIRLAISNKNNEI